MNKTQEYDLPSNSSQIDILAFDKSQFEEWLRTGFDCYFKENMGPWAFPGAEAEIAAEYDLVQGLSSTYRQLPCVSQGYFREGIANVLASLPPSKAEYKTCDALLDLAAILPVPSALEPVYMRIGQGFFGQGKSKLYQKALLLLIQMANPRKDEYVSSLKKMISARNFHCGYAGIALVALCRADVDGFIDHLSILKDALLKMLNIYDDANKRQLADMIVNTIGMGVYVNCLDSIYTALKEDKYEVLREVFLNCPFRKNGSHIVVRDQSSTYGLSISTPLLRIPIQFKTGNMAFNFLSYFDENDLISEDPDIVNVFTDPKDLSCHSTLRC